MGILKYAKYNFHDWKIVYRDFKFDHPVIFSSMIAGVLIGASCLYISHCNHERKVDRVADQVSVLENYVETGNLDGARSLSQSLYDDLHDEKDPRLKGLYGDFVFPCFKAFKNPVQSQYHNDFNKR